MAFLELPDAKLWYLQEGAGPDIAFSQDMQAPPSLGRGVADLARDGHYHLLEGLGHLSLVGHRPETVNACIREILAAYEDRKA